MQPRHLSRNWTTPLVASPKRAAAWGAMIMVGVISALGATPATAAADSSALLHYRFDTAANGVVPDVSGNGNDGTLRNVGGTVADGLLTLPGGSADSAPYLDIPTDDLAGVQTLTSSIWLESQSPAGNTAAAFIGTPVGDGQFSAGYWLLNPANPNGYVKSVITDSVNPGAPWTTEVGAGSTNAPTSGLRTPTGMALYTTVIDGPAGTLTSYVNGERIAQTAITRDVASFGPDLVAYLGRSTYADAGWKGSIDEVVLSDVAMTATEVQDAFIEQSIEKASSGLRVPTEATSDFPLPSTSYGTHLSWTSDDAAIVVEDGLARVVRPTNGEQDATVTLTATVTAGDRQETLAFPVRVAADRSDAEKLALDLEGIRITNSDDIRSNFSVPGKGPNGSSFTWSVIGGTEAATVRAGVDESSKTIDVVRPATGSAVTVTLRATARIAGSELTRDITVSVQPLPADQPDPEAYVWAFFTGEGSGAEQVSLAASKGNDALSWNTLNEGKPIFTSTQGTTGLRDPFILRSPDGDRFFMIATDLKIDGLPGGFATAQISGSRYIEVWESNDLVTWSEQRHVKVSSDFAGNTWAPEAYWDDKLDTFVVFWASNLYDTTDESQRTNVTYNRMMYATTDDFITFSDPEPWIDVSRGPGLGTIDSSVTKSGDYYYRFTKDEGTLTIREERSTDLLATEKGTLPGAGGPADQWSLVKDQVASGLPNGEPGGVYLNGEGPSVFPANPGDVNGLDWYLFIDQPDYHGGPNHYIPFGTDSLDDGDSWEPLGAKLRENLPQNADGGKPRHGTVIPVTRAEYERLLTAYAPGVAVQDVSVPEVVTAVGTAPSLPSAVLTKVDGSIETVPVDWAAVQADQYGAPGSFTVSGTAADDARTPVDVTVTVRAGGALPGGPEPSTPPAAEPGSSSGRDADSAPGPRDGLASTGVDTEAVALLATAATIALLVGGLLTRRRTRRGEI